MKIAEYEVRICVGVDGEKARMLKIGAASQLALDFRFRFQDGEAAASDFRCRAVGERAVAAALGYLEF